MYANSTLGQLQYFFLPWEEQFYACINLLSAVVVNGMDSVYSVNIVKYTTCTSYVQYPVNSCYKTMKQKTIF